ncbi:TPA: hypothetical protein ACGSBP_003887 [Escherichia coli]
MPDVIPRELPAPADGFFTDFKRIRIIGRCHFSCRVAIGVTVLTMFVAVDQ